MPTSRAVVATPHASRYLQQLCKHWAHKFETRFTPLEGRIALPLGEARLAADAEHLTIDLVTPEPATAEGDEMDRFRDVVQSHVERFAFRETLGFSWIPLPDDADSAEPDPDTKL